MSSQSMTLLEVIAQHAPDCVQTAWPSPRADQINPSLTFDPEIQLLHSQRQRAVLEKWVWQYTPAGDVMCWEV